MSSPSKHKTSVLPEEGGEGSDGFVSSDGFSSDGWVATASGPGCGESTPASRAGSTFASPNSVGLERELALALAGLRDAGPDVGFVDGAQLLLAGLGEAADAFAGEEGGGYSAAESATATAGADIVR